MTREGLRMRPGLALLAGLVAMAATTGCDEEQKKAPPDPTPEESPYADSAWVRFVHLAPSISGVAVELPVAPNQYRVVGDAIEVVGEPQLRALSTQPLALTAFTREQWSTPATGARVVVREGGNTVFDGPLSGLSPQQSYLLVLVESIGATALEVLPVWQPAPGDAPDGQARLGVFHAVDSLGTVDLALEPIGGGSGAQWASVSLGRSTLDAPTAVAPGEYRFHVLDGAEPAPIVAPRTLTLEADTVVHIILAPPGRSAGEQPRVLFVVDDAHAPERHVDGDWVRVEPEPQ